MSSNIECVDKRLFVYVVVMDAVPQMSTSNCLGKRLFAYNFSHFYWQRVLGGWACSRRWSSTGMERLRELVLWSNCRLLSWAQHALTSTRYLTLNDDVPGTKEATYIILEAKNLLTVLRLACVGTQYKPCAKTKWGTSFAGRCYRKSKILYKYSALPVVSIGGLNYEVRLRGMCNTMMLSF